MDQVFHVECFTCATCHSRLRGQPFYAIDRRSYCESCYIVSVEGAAGGGLGYLGAGLEWSLPGWPLQWDGNLWRPLVLGAGIARLVETERGRQDLGGGPRLPVLPTGATG